MKLGPDTGRTEKTVMMEIFHLMLFLCEADVVRQEHSALQHHFMETAVVTVKGKKIHTCLHAHTDIDGRD